jgi:hypothetical protein
MNPLLYSICKNKESQLLEIIRSCGIQVTEPAKLTYMEKAFEYKMALLRSQQYHCGHPRPPHYQKADSLNLNHQALKQKNLTLAVLPLETAIVVGFNYLKHRLDGDCNR